MEANQQVRILSDIRQNLFRPDSPIWVSHTTLRLERSGGKKLLQVRMINCSDRNVCKISLRIVCFDENRLVLAQLETVSVPQAFLRPGNGFTAELVLEHSAPETTSVEAFAQTVCFEDHTVWTENDPDGYIAFRCDAVPPDSPDREALEARARSGHVKNDYYFLLRKELWVCTCGVPNPIHRQHCVKCGADRQWLEQNMNSELLRRSAFASTADLPPDTPTGNRPAPALSVLPVAFPIPEAPKPAAPNQTSEKADSEVGDAPEDSSAAEQELQMDRECAQKGKKAVLILIAAVVLLAAAVLCLDQLLMPYLRYKRALRRQEERDYAQASAIFTALGDYRDSPARLIQIRDDKARALMVEERYQEALEYLEALDGENPLIADCLYALGVIAYNDGDLELGLQYTKKLRDRFPDYDKGETLEQYCSYSMGVQYAEKAATADYVMETTYYEEAIKYFTEAGACADAQERVKECRYRLAWTYAAKWNLEEAIDLYGELGDYRDSAEQRLNLMYSFVRYYWDTQEQDADDYLRELVAADYDGIGLLMDIRNSQGASFTLSLGNGETQLPREITDCSEVYVCYQIPHSDDARPALVRVRCFLPDDSESDAALNADGSDAGLIGWGALGLPAVPPSNGTVTLVFYLGEYDDDWHVLDYQSFNLVSESPEQGGAAP